MLGLLQDAMSGMLPGDAFRGKIVIYVSYAQAAPVVAEAINTAALLHAGSTLRAVACTGKLDDSERRAALSDWNDMAGAQILVSTCVIGTGMDPKHEVALIVHARLPPSVLDLWQEWGRAGRKGGPAWCILCVSPMFVTQTLRFAADQPDILREQLVQELVEVVALAVLPGCRRRLLDGMISGEVRAGLCGACDMCCSGGVCGLWSAFEKGEWEATGMSEAILESLRPSVHVPALTLAQALRAPPTSAAGAAELSVDMHGRLLLRLVAEGALRIVWEGGAFRLQTDISALRHISMRLRSVRLALPLSMCPPTCMPAATGMAAREAALVELHAAHIDMRSAEKRKIVAVRSYCQAGGSVRDDTFRALVAKML